MNDETVRTVVLALLGTGGAAFVWTVTRSILAFRNSAEGREDKAISRLEVYERDCRTQLASERQWGAYWQRRAATLEYVLRVNGHSVPPSEPEPPAAPGGAVG